MKLEITVKANWSVICQSIREYELVDQLKERMKICLTDNLKYNSMGVNPIVIFKDSEKSKYIDYGIGVNVQEDNLNDIKAQMNNAVNVIDAFINYDVPVLYERLMKEKGLD